MSEEWNVDTQPVTTVTVGHHTESFEGEVTAEQVKDVASDNGVKNFKVQNSDGEGLDHDEFPYTGDIVVNEYNENA